jgi:hypothetical protein
MTHDERRLLRHPLLAVRAYRVAHGKVTVAHVRANDPTAC